MGLEVISGRSGKRKKDYWAICYSDERNASEEAIQLDCDLSCYPRFSQGT